MLGFLKQIFSRKQPPLNEQKILVIEDSPVDQRIAVSAIDRGRYIAIVAGDGQTGFDLALAHKPSLIVLDYNLPDTTGPELCVKLKRHPETKNIPIIFLTSMDTPSSVVECFDKGGDNYLSKPISSKLLLKYIEDLLKENNNA